MTAPGGPADPFATYDAAYVLGALTEDDRAAYIAHLETCDSCRDAVARLAPLPQLLARVPSVDAAVGETDDSPVPPMPETLMPGLLQRARRSRRRRRLTVGAAAAVAAACLVTGTALVADQGSAPPAGRVVAMSTPAAVPLQASLQMHDKAWGTELTMHCLYTGYVGSGTTTYELVVVARSGGTPQTVARWTVIPGRDATVTGSTELTAAQIARVQVRTGDGTVVLQS